MKKEITRKLKNDSVLGAIILLFLLFTCYIVASNRINAITTDSCFRSLDDAATQLAVDIREIVVRNEEDVKIVAQTLEHDKLEPSAVQQHISHFPQSSTLTDLSVLLSDGTMLYSASGYEDWGEKLDFESEIKKIPYYSGVNSMGETADKKFVYQAVPVWIDGEQKAVLYGIMRLDDLAESFTVEAFQGISEQYVMENTTGELLVDTWHNKLGNLYDGSMARPVREGYEGDNWTDHIRRGEKSYLVAHSEKAGEAFYVYSVPVGVNNWSVMLTVPESSVFQSAIQIKRVLYAVGIFNIVIMLCYLLYVLSGARRTVKRREEKLKQMAYMYEMQHILFDAHKEPECVTRALERMAERLSAENTFLCTLEGERIRDFYLWPDFSVKRNVRKEPTLYLALPAISERLQRGESILYDLNRKDMEPEKTDKETFLRHGIKNMVMTPVLDSAGQLIGVLGGTNMAKAPEGTDTLECVASNFMMAIRNISSYQIIEKLGTTDCLTGLKNRNSFEMAMEEYIRREEDGFGCVYIDANGLHALNNEKGHAAGDAMLRCVAENLTEIFSPENVYRIGGDEFVAFFKQKTEEEVKESICVIQAQTSARGYHISAGAAWREKSDSVNEMLDAAEKMMYDEKRKYYEEKGGAARIQKEKA